MNINGIGANKVVNIYNVNKKQQVEKTKELKSDSIEISSTAKSLSKISTDETFGVSAERLEQLKKEVQSGTYKVDGKLVAQKLIDVIKEREV